MRKELLKSSRVQGDGLEGKQNQVGGDSNDNAGCIGMKLQMNVLNENDYEGAWLELR